MSVPSDDAQRRLQRLQEELVQLKHHIGSLQLRKASAAAGGAAPPASAPFPITITGDLALPPAAARYDVESLQLRLVLKSAAAAPPAPRGQLAAAVELQLLSPSLPASLREAMAREVHAAWVSSLPSEPASLGLAAFWEILGRDFVRLISLQPQLLEAYEGVDEAGRTVRRFAILNQEAASLQIDASLPGANPPGRSAASSGAKAGVMPAAVATAAGAKEEEQSVQPAGVAASPAAAPLGPPAEPSTDGLPPALAREVAALRGLYGAGVHVLHAAQQQRGSSSSSAAAATASLHQLSLGGYGPSRPGQQTPPPPPEAAAAEVSTAAAPAAEPPPPLLELQIILRPTDPAWDPRSTLTLRCALAAAYPAPGSLTIALEPHPPLPALPLQVLQRLAGEEVEVALGAPGRAGALRSAVRQIENHAGRLVRDAEDLALEIVQRRRGAAAAAPPLRAAGAGPGAAASQHAQHGVQTAGQQQHQRQRQPLSPPLAGGGASWDSDELSDDGAGYHPRQHSPRRRSGSQFGGSGTEGFSASASSSEASWDSQDEGEEGEAAGGSAERAGGLGHSEGGPRGGLQLQLEGLSLADCDSLEILRLNLQVGCSRCRRSAADITFATPAVALPSDSPGSGSGARGSALAGPRAAATAASPASSSQPGGGLEWHGECPGCHNPWAVQLAPKLVHERSNTLAVVRAEGCAPMDMLPSMLAGQCGRCGAAAAFRSVHVGAPNERSCGRCHSKISFQFASALFVAAPSAASSGRGRPFGAAGGAAHAAGAAAAAAAAFNGVLVPGQPLPDRGTCRHYRHSYRWLRFPCCGRRFPCDLCHEELTDGHEMRWATRMVCGHCSREQPVAEHCKHCGKKLGASAAAPAGRATRFWEGGAGCRDPRRMNRKDPRKHRGSRAKTQSRKSSRVGEKAAGRRDARAAPP